MKHIRVRCILFDLDGTLYNSSEYSNHLEEEISRIVSEELRIDEPHAKLLVEQRRKAIGTLTRTIESLGISRSDFYRKMASRVEPRTYLSPETEVREALMRLKQMGFQIGLVSNSGRELVDKILDAIGLENTM
ncbi:MAG: HAD family hydrolase, partial [Candidatus Bathyarchaeia archaeon]